MLTCQSCMRHFLQIVFSESAYLSSAIHSIRPTTVQLIQRELTYNRYFHLSTHQKAIAERAFNRNGLDSSRNASQATMRGPKNYRPPGYYGPNSLDPVRLAEFVKSSLKRDQVDVASDAVRNASTKIQCVVSWNHLIDWWMSKGRMKSAISIFHEMKKRGQTPDAYTYTIIFRGCAQHEHSAQALGKVMAIYRSMLLDKSPVKPNSIHMNSVMKMCSLAGDVESLLSLASEMPSRGIGASNAMTFAIILNALRHDATSHLPKALSDKQRTENIRAAVLQATHIWEDIIDRWKKGNLTIDEELVCSMGRMLLISEDKRHWDEVLSIVEQTMGIPRQIPPLSSPERWKMEPDLQSRNPSEFMKYSQPNHQDDSSDQSVTSETKPQVTDQNIENSAANSFESNLTTSSIAPGVDFYAKLGRNSLSLVLKALLLLSKKEPAIKYWEIFTEQYNVQPDLENYVSYLRILRLSRASTKAVELLEKIPMEFRVPKVFRIAMSSCMRDKNNHNAFSNTGKILDMMQSALKEPDLPTIIRYLQLTLSSVSLTQKNSPGSIADLTSKYSERYVDPGKEILRALDRVAEILLPIKSSLFYTDPGLEQKTESEKQTYQADIDSLIRLSIAGHAILLERNLVPKKLHSELIERKMAQNSLRVRLKRRFAPTIYQR